MHIIKTGDKSRFDDIYRSVLDAQIGRYLRSVSIRNALRLYYSLIHKNTNSLKNCSLFTILLFIEHARFGRFYIPVFGRDKSRIYIKARSIAPLLFTNSLNHYFTKTNRSPFSFPEKASVIAHRSSVKSYSTNSKCAVSPGNKSNKT